MISSKYVQSKSLIAKEDMTQIRVVVPGGCYVWNLKLSQ